MIWEFGNVTPKPIGEALTQAMIRLKGYGKAMIDSIMKIGMFMSI